MRAYGCQSPGVAPVAGFSGTVSGPSNASLQVGHAFHLGAGLPMSLAVRSAAHR